jgi:hypothetical protein
LFTAGCGGTSEPAGPTAAERASAAASEKATAAEEKAAAARAKAIAARQAKRSAIYKECKTVAGPLNDQLTGLNSRMSVGVPFAKYSDLVGEAQVAYDKLLREAKARGGLSSPCVNRVGTPLESGLNAYIKAYNTWNDCIGADYCTFDEGTAELKKAQASWANAGRLVTKADAALLRLRP